MSAGHPDVPEEAPASLVARVVGDHRFALALVAALIGTLVGGAAVLFNLMIRAWTWVSTGYQDYSTHPGAPHGVWGWSPWFLVMAPVVAGLVYGPMIQKWAPSARGHGIPEVMLAVRRRGGRIPGRVAVVKLVASALTIGSGGSAGREGPIVQIGASLGSSLATRLGLPTNRVVLLATCGSAAGIAATFHAPLAGAVFALEVILLQFSAEAFGYTVISAVMASIVARALQGDAPLVDLHEDLVLTSLPDMWWVALLGLVAGLSGLAFSKMLYGVEDVIDWIWARLRLPEWARPAVLGVVLGLGLLAVPVLYGSGYPIQLDALQGHYTIAVLLALALGRAVFTSWTIGIGGSGGIFAPTLFIGAMVGTAFGQAIAPLTVTAPAVFGVIGMGAAFAGAARAPMTAVLIIVEMTGQYSLILPMMLAVVIATACSRFLTRSTIYTEKLRRRGDILDDPVDHTLLGAHPAGRLMQPAPALVSTTDSVHRAVALLRASEVQSLPVVDPQRRFVGVATALDLATWTAQGGDPGAPVGGLALRDTHVGSADLPSAVLRVFATTGAEGVPVLDDTHRVVGWITARDLTGRMYRDQRRAVEARHQTSWGSRWLERHHHPTT